MLLAHSSTLIPPQNCLKMVALIMLCTGKRIFRARSVSLEPRLTNQERFINPNSQDICHSSEFVRRSKAISVFEKSKLGIIMKEYCVVEKGLGVWEKGLGVWEKGLGVREKVLGVWEKRLGRL